MMVIKSYKFSIERTGEQGSTTFWLCNRPEDGKRCTLKPDYHQPPYAVAKVVVHHPKSMGDWDGRLQMSSMVLDFLVNSKVIVFVSEEEGYSLPS